MAELSIDYRLHLHSGIGRYLRTIVPCLLKEKFANINLLGGKDADAKHVTMIQSNSDIYTISEQLKIPKLIPSSSDLLWVPHYNIPLFYQGNLMVTIHDLAHLALPDLFSGITKRVYARTLFSAIKYKADQIICVSEFTKKELIKYVGVNEDKIKVIYNGLEEEWYNVSKEKSPGDRPYLLYVGNVKPHKNLKTLVKAFLNIRDKIPHNLVLVGQKEGFLTRDEEIDSLIEKASNRITFTGYISDELLKQYYSFADLFVFPSLYEGFGYPPLEAMACGTPVIASNAASIPEVCGDAASYFEPTNVEELSYKIENLLSDVGFKKELIQRGIKQSQKFTVEECASQTANVLKSVI